MSSLSYINLTVLGLLYYFHDDLYKWCSGPWYVHMWHQDGSAELCF